ncbi:MAG: hypothetical protein IPP60_12260 [Sphingobacteriales bacterium]|nr:hypothetical protein [Sphingobacteriales bacterium]MBP8192649.1 hypothetical protein [Chitinophagales bacterium]
MKHLFIFCFLLITSFSIYANSEDAIAYNDKIVSEQTKIGEAILAFSTNPNDFSLTQIRTQAENSLGVLNGMKPMDGNKDFLVAAKALFKFYAGITKNEYKKILELIQEKDKYTSEQITAKINELTESISKKEVPLDAQFKDAQVAFAKKYNFTLRKNDLEEKFKDAKEE